MAVDNLHVYRGGTLWGVVKVDVEYGSIRLVLGNAVIDSGDVGYRRVEGVGNLYRGVSSGNAGLFIAPTVNGGYRGGNA